jgi:hypothetical protein
LRSPNETPFIAPFAAHRSEFLIFLGFLALATLTIWPWILHLRDAVPDTGDPYAISYFMWWDFHQTFHAPLHLFEATILYPYHYTLAFGIFRRSRRAITVWNLTW